MKHGYSPAMKYIERTHGVCLRFLAERFIEDQCHLFWCQELIFGGVHTVFDAESGYDSPGSWREI